MKRTATMSLATVCVASLLAAGCQDGYREGVYGANESGGKQPTISKPKPSQFAVTDDVDTATLATVKGGPAQGRRDGKLEPAALFYGGPLPTSFALGDGGRVYLAFPRWSTPVSFTVGVLEDGKLEPFPNAEVNQFNREQPQQTDPAKHFVSVQAVVADDADRLWVLDTGNLNMERTIPGGTKLLAYDMKSRKLVKSIDLKPVLKPNTYINDARFDLTKGQEGVGYITDSGAGGLIVFDIATGEAWRKLDGHPSAMAEKGVTLNVEGEPMKKRPAGGQEQPVEIHADGIALSPDGATLYWTPLTGRSIYAAPTSLLLDREASDESLGAEVRKVAEKPSANDGIVCDAKGRIYTTDFEDNAIRRVDPQTGVSELLVQDERLLWPDGIMVRDGAVYVTSNQLNRQPSYHGGKNLLQEPFVLFKYPVADAEAIKRR